MAKIPRPQGEVDKQLAIQLKMLREACDRFDAGADYEAPNLARIMRILFRKTRNQHPLLEQAGLEGSMFVDTAIQETTGGLLSYAGLISTALRSDGTVGFRADLDDRLGNRLVAFDEWWNASVIRTQQGQRYTRADVVLAVADQDGGTHVDPTLSEAYFELSRNNVLAWHKQENGGPTEPLADPHYFMVRQIAHEALRSLLKGYQCMPVDLDSTVISGAEIITVEPTDLTNHDRFRLGRRNAICPCGKGKKIKHCCGALTH